MTGKIFILFTGVLLIFSACSIKITKQEKALLPYKNMEKAIFISESGSRDSILIDATRDPNEPLDTYLYQKLILKTGGSNKRYYTKMITLKTFNENFSYDRSRIYPSTYTIFYSKFPGEDSMWVTIDGFDQTYVLANTKSDTLIFTDSGCTKINLCVNKILYHKKYGIIHIESSRDLWKLQKLTRYF